MSTFKFIAFSLILMASFPTVADRIIDLEGYRNTVSQIENGSLRVTINLD